MCKKGSISVFTNYEPIILRVTKFSVNKENIEKFLPRCHKTIFYESDDWSLNIKVAYYTKLSPDVSQWNWNLPHTSIKVLKSPEQTLQDFPELKENLHPCLPFVLKKVERNALDTVLTELVTLVKLFTLT